MLFRYNNLKFLLILNFYDLIHKYLYFNFFLIPKVTKLSFKIFLKGFFNLKFFKKYLSNFLLLYFFIFNIPYVTLKLFKVKKRKSKLYKIKLFLNYFLMQKRVLLTMYTLYMFFFKHARPLFFKSVFLFSRFSGKLYSINIKIITFLPYTILFDKLEQKFVKFFKNSKIFLTFFLKNILTTSILNFFSTNSIVHKNYLKNILLFWCLN